MELMHCWFGTKLWKLPTASASLARLRLLAIGMCLIALAILMIACSEIGLDTGGCHHGQTGEPLKEVRDAKGETFPVKKLDTNLSLLGQELILCGVSIDAAVKTVDTGWGSDYFVFHPTTGAEIEVGGAVRGLREIDYPTWEWY